MIRPEKTRLELPTGAHIWSPAHQGSEAIGAAVCIKCEGRLRGGPGQTEYLAIRQVPSNI
jgi:hypothetical protein